MRSDQGRSTAQGSLTAHVDSPLVPPYNRRHRGKQPMYVHVFCFGLPSAEGPEADVFCFAEADIRVNLQTRGEYENAYRRRLGGGF